MVPANVPGADGHRVRCHLDRLLEERGLTLRALSDMVGISTVNLSVMKNDRAKAVRFSTLTLLCDALACTRFRAALLTQPACPSTRSSQTGRSGNAASRSAAVGKVFSGQSFWSQPVPSSQAPAGKVAA